MIWDGTKSSERSFEQLLSDVQGRSNQESAVGRLREKVLAGIRAIDAKQNDDGRIGAMARNAMEHIRKEAK